MKCINTDENSYNNVIIHDFYSQRIFSAEKVPYRVEYTNKWYL